MSPRAGTIETRGLFAGAVVAAVTFMVFLPALGCDFVNWDDPYYVYENTNIRSLGPEFFKWVSGAIVVSNWHPLTMFSHAVDYALFGLDPRGHHLMALVLHSVNTVLVFILARSIVTCYASESTVKSVAPLAAIVCALLFGMHPIHVESVVWISERKDLLSALFFLLSLIFYIAYARGGSVRAYALAILAFILSLLSKPMGVTLPVVLILLDYAPLGRIEVGDFPGQGLMKAKKVLYEKIPFFAISIIFTIITIASQSGGGLRTIESHPIALRIAVSLRGYLFYIYKAIWPAELAPLYPYPEGAELTEPVFILSFIVFVAVSLLCLVAWKRRPYLMTIWLYYVVTLLPVIGIVQIGLQSAADRYFYLPGLVFFLCAGLIAARFSSSRGGVRTIVIATVVVWATLLGSKTTSQSALWKDSVTLWSHQMRLYPESPALVVYNLGSAYFDLGDTTRAIEEFDRAILLDPDYANIYLDRGSAYYKEMKTGEAIVDFSRAIDLNPEHVGALVSRAIAFSDLGEIIKAAGDVERALRADPSYAPAYLQRGIFYVEARRYGEAIKDYTRAIEEDPYLTDAHVARGTAFFMAGEKKKALVDYKSALDLDPGYALVYYNLAALYRELGREKLVRENLKRAAELGIKEAGEDLRNLDRGNLTR